MCIFSTPKLFAGIKEIYPEEFEALKRDEEILGFTLDNKCDLETFVGDAESCVYHGDFEALRSLITGEFTIDQPKKAEDIVNALTAAQRERN